MQEDFFRKVNPLGVTDWRKKVEAESISIEPASDENSKEYRDIRLEALEKEPKAFNITPEEMDIINKIPEAEWRKKINKPNQVTFLAKFENKTIGLARAMQEYEKVWFVYSVYLNEDFRKSKIDKNIALDMLQKVLDAIKEKGGEKAILLVRRTQKPAIKLYEDLGFRDISPFREPLYASRLVGNMNGNPANFIKFRLMELDFNIKKDNT